MGLSRNKVAVSEGAAGSPPFYGERVIGLKVRLRKRLDDLTEIERVGEILPRKECCSIFNVQALKESVLQTQRVHLFPFRTQKLSSAVATILYGKLYGKIVQC